MGIKRKKLKKSLKKRYKYIDPITYAIVNYDQERTKYEADAASNLLTGAGDSRRDYIKEVLMDGINERITLLGSYITDKLLYEGPHVDQLTYFNQNFYNNAYTDLVGKVEASIKERTSIVPNFTPLDLVKALTGNQNITQVLLEEYGFFDLDWKIREIVTIHHPKYFASGNWEVEILDERTHELDEEGNVIDEVIDTPEGKVRFTILLYDEEDFSSWSEEDQNNYKELYGADYEFQYEINSEDIPDRYAAIYSEPMEPEITTEITYENGLVFSPDHLSPVDNYVIYRDDTVENVVDLFRTEKIYREELDENSDPYWDLVDESTFIYDTLDPVYSGEIEFRKGEGVDMFTNLHFIQLNKFDWTSGTYYTEDEYTEIEYIQPEPDPLADPNDPLPDPVPVTVKYKKETTTDTLDAYTDITNTISTETLEYLHSYKILNVPIADANAYYHIAPVPVRMFPVIPLRYEYNWVDMDTSPSGKELNTYINRYIRLLLGIKKDKLLDSLKDSFEGDTDKVESAVINFAVPINTTDPKARWYLFDFFKRYSSNVGAFQEALDDFHTELAAAKEVFDRLLVFTRPNGIDLFLVDPVTGVEYGRITHFPVPSPPALPPVTVLPIVNSINKYKLDRTLSWVSIYKQFPGLYKPDLKPNDVITENLSSTLYTAPVLAMTSFNKVEMVYPDTNDKILRMVRQRETYHEIIELPTLRIESREALGISVTQDVEQAFEQDEGNVILSVPLVKDIFIRMPAPMKAQTALAAITMSYGILYTYKVRTSLGKVLDSISKIHKTAVNTYRLSGGASDLLRSFERMHRIPTQEIFKTMGHTMARSDRDFENGFMKVFGGSRGLAKTWHGIIKIIIVIIITIFTAGIGGAVAAGVSAGAAIAASFATITAQQIALMIASAVIAMVAEITQQTYAHKMAKLESETSKIAAEYEQNLKQLDAIEKSLGLALEGYDLTKMFNYNVSAGLSTEPMMSFDTSEEFLASMNTDPKSLGMLQDMATFEYISMSRQIFSNTEINLVDYFNHSQAV